MINHIYDLEKQKLQVNGHAWFHLQVLRRTFYKGNKRKIKNEITCLYRKWTSDPWHLDSYCIGIVVNLCLKLSQYSEVTGNTRCYYWKQLSGNTIYLIDFGCIMYNHRLSDKIWIYFTKVVVIYRCGNSPVVIVVLDPRYDLYTYSGSIFMYVFSVENEASHKAGNERHVRWSCWLHHVYIRFLTICLL